LAGTVEEAIMLDALSHANAVMGGLT